MIFITYVVKGNHNTYISAFMCDIKGLINLFFNTFSLVSSMNECFVSRGGKKLSHTYFRRLKFVRRMRGEKRKDYESK